MHLCTEVIPRVSEEAANAALEETEDNAIGIGTPVLGSLDALLRSRGVIFTGKKWEPGRTLKVAFMGGVASVRERVKRHALTWTKYANLDFEFVDDRFVRDAEVRIAFNGQDGSWSYLGTDAKTIAGDEPTMNFGWLEPDTDEEEYARVVPHEFGHALAMPHEHQHPKAGIPWDVPAVYRYYSGPPNYWDKETIDHNVLGRYSETITKFREFDRESIMLYPIPDELTLGTWSVGWNTNLSAGDKAFAMQEYPGRVEPPAPPPPPQPPPTRPLFADLPRIHVSRYSWQGWHQECVVERGGTSISYSVPFREAIERKLYEKDN